MTTFRFGTLTYVIQITSNLEGTMPLTSPTDRHHRQVVALPRPCSPLRRIPVRRPLARKEADAPRSPALSLPQSPSHLYPSSLSSIPTNIYINSGSSRAPNSPASIPATHTHNRRDTPPTDRSNPRTMHTVCMPCRRPSMIRARRDHRDTTSRRTTALRHTTQERRSTLTSEGMDRRLGLLRSRMRRRLDHLRVR
jgi:hypothetical protein